MTFVLVVVLVVVLGIARWRPAMLGVVIVWGGITLSRLVNPDAVVLAIALVALIAWLIGRLRTSH